MSKKIIPPEPPPISAESPPAPADKKQEVSVVIRREMVTIEVPLVPLEQVLQGFLPARIHDLSLETHEERLLFSQLKQALIQSGEKLEGRNGPRFIKTNSDVIRWIVQKLGGVRKKSHKFNGQKIEKKDCFARAALEEEATDDAPH